MRAIPAAHGDCPSASGISRGISPCLSSSFLRRGVNARALRACGLWLGPGPCPAPRSVSVNSRRGGTQGREHSHRAGAGRVGTARPWGDRAGAGPAVWDRPAVRGPHRRGWRCPRTSARRRQGAVWPRSARRVARGRSAGRRGRGGAGGRISMVTPHAEAAAAAAGPGRG